MSNAEKFWDKVAKKYAKTPIKNIQAYNETMEHTKNHLSYDLRLIRTERLALATSGNRLVP